MNEEDSNMSSHWYGRETQYSPHGIVGCPDFTMINKYSYHSYVSLEPLLYKSISLSQITALFAYLKKILIKFIS